ncbi:MAG: hypothetical protein B7X39_09420 [Lysobacterales bacterium 14-68-21]|jgi:hypothetical protein|nr:MAG: hypothetical protein B7X45_05090 [Xanthomonadales bacterium 15-68-25]OZB66896.1 MAG: hypothetical protein B7X39_09420 [Xanthomonadales bacterium 14-68-21]
MRKAHDGVTRHKPLRELWTHDPESHLIEVHARLIEQELAAKPTDQEAVCRAPSTALSSA